MSKPGEGGSPSRDFGVRAPGQMDRRVSRPRDAADLMPARTQHRRQILGLERVIFDDQNSATHGCLRGTRKLTNGRYRPYVAGKGKVPSGTVI